MILPLTIILLGTGTPVLTAYKYVFSSQNLSIGPIVHVMASL